MPRAAYRGIAIALSLLLGTGSLPTVALAEATQGNTSTTASQSSTPETDGVIITPTRQANDELQLLSEEGEDADSSELAQKLSESGLELSGQFEGDNGSTALVVKAADGSSDESALNKALEIEGVATAQLNYVYHLIDAVDGDRLETAGTELLDISRSHEAQTLASKVSLIPANDPYLLNAASSDAYNEYWAYSAKLPAAWRQAKTDSKVTVAVLDSGCNLAHEDLSANVMGELAFNARAKVDGDVDNITNVQDSNGHGTHVAGIVAASANNGKGIAGASYNAKVVPIKVVSAAGTASSASMAAAYEYLFGLVDQGIVEDLRVVNISLGAYISADEVGTTEQFDFDGTLHDAIKKARDTYGIVTTCAGGNGQLVTSNGVTTRVPRTDNIYPADWDECVSVTALAADGANISWSDYNEQKDISAPGDNVLSTYKGGPSSYAKLSGSSMASPLVAGTFALMFAEDPDATVEEACEALYETADPINDSANDRTETSGSHGAINAVSALDRLLSDELPSHFDDVLSGDWFYESISFASRSGIMKGYANQQLAFGPNDNITRAQMAIVLYNYLGNGEISPAAQMADVSQSADCYYRNAVNWAVSHRVMNGYADGSNRFGVDDPITREQVAIVFANLLAKDNELQEPTEESLSAFSSMPDHDSTDDWARESVIWALGKKILSGARQADGTRLVEPTMNCSRAMTATVMVNAIKSGVL